MADTKISALPSASTPLTGTEVLPIVQGAANFKVSVADLTTGRALSATAITLTSGTANGVAYLDGSKVLTTGSALTFDGTTLVGNAAYGSGTAALILKNASAAVVSNIVEQQFWAADTFTGLTQKGAFGLDTTTGVGNQYGSFYWKLANAGAPAEQMRLTSSGLEVKQSQLIGYSSYAGLGSYGLAVAGNVGIGTSSPGVKLDVSYSDTAYNPGIRVKNTSNNSASQAKVYVVNDADQYFSLGRNSTVLGSASVLFSTGAYPIDFYTNSTFRATIDSVGKLSVGTFGDTGRKLEVNASEALLDGAGQFDLLMGDGAVAYMSLTTTDNATALKIRNYSGNSDIAVFERTTGNVGIGTSSPRTKFDVLLSGTANTGGSLAPSFGLFTGPGLEPITDGSRAGANVNIESNTAQGANVGASLMFGGRYVDSSTVSTGFGAIYGAKENGTSNNLAGYLAFYTNRSGVTTKAMTIDSSGNLGLGVTPSASTSNYQTLQIGGGSSVRYGIFGQRVLGSAENFMGWNAYGGNNTTTYATGFYYTNSGDGATMYSQTNFHSWHIAGTGTAGNPITFTQAMTLDASGNLGVGTTSPVGRLEAVGGTGAGFNGWFRTGDTTAANNAGGGFYNTSSATAANRSAIMALDADGANLSGGDYFIVQKNGNSGSADILQYSNASIRFGTNFTNRAAYDMTLDASGNLSNTGTIGFGAAPAALRSSISTNITAGSSQVIYGTVIAGNMGAYMMVKGVDASGNWFVDFLTFLNSNAVTLLAGMNGGSPGSRTYAVASGTLSLNPSVTQTSVRVSASEV
jgi:hypothetical protein